LNFPLIMLILLVITGGIWLLDRFVLSRSRPEGAHEPWWVEYPKSFFPVILIVFVLRSFLVEPFKIPSGSMIPTLLIGDFILVNKYTYGIRLPVANVKVLDIGSPKRGDVMVFRYPENPSVDFIKRVVAVPGDRITYRDKQLEINGKPVALQPVGDYSYVEGGISFINAKRLTESLADTAHDILVQSERPTLQMGSVRRFPLRENCEYNDFSFTCTVPSGHYFTMGDNRDASDDSRYWGFVPERNIVGRAFMVWWNFDAMSRIGTRIH
jgi:signal peptidase I